MSNKKPSPGPWEWDGESPEIDSASGAVVCYLNEHKSLHTIAVMGQQFSHADAALIADAPAMLDLLAFIAPIASLLIGQLDEPERRLMQSKCDEAHALLDKHGRG